MLKKSWPRHVCAITTAKSRPKPDLRPFRSDIRPDMNWPTSSSSVDISRGEEVHGSQDKVPGIIHRLGHAIQKRLARRGGLPRSRQLANRAGFARSRSSRHDWRKPDAEP